jgi:hypothetical protein
VAGSEVLRRPGLVPRLFNREGEMQGWTKVQPFFVGINFNLRLFAHGE